MEQLAFVRKAISTTQIMKFVNLVTLHVPYAMIAATALVAISNILTTTINFASYAIILVLHAK